MKLLEIENAIECRIISRLNRFVVEIKVDGVKKRASINNTGRLRELIVKGKRGYCIKKGIKTDYRLFGVKTGRYAAIIDTQLQMKSFEVALNKNAISWLKNCVILGRNVKVYNSRIDYLLSCYGNELLLELKSAALRKNRNAMYPDCPSIRGRKHILDLIKCVDSQRAAILFIAAVPGVRAFKPNKKADKEIYKLLNKAVKAGVVVKSISIYYDTSNNSIFLANPDLKVKL